MGWINERNFDGALGALRRAIKAHSRWVWRRAFTRAHIPLWCRLFGHRMERRSWGDSPFPYTDEGCECGLRAGKLLRSSFPLTR